MEALTPTQEEILWDAIPNPAKTDLQRIHVYQGPILVKRKTVHKRLAWKPRSIHYTGLSSDGAPEDIETTYQELDQETQQIIDLIMRLLDPPGTDVLPNQISFHHTEIYGKFVMIILDVTLQTHTIHGWANP